jgi:3-oxoacyl-[acyl-carrier protein] reductase
MILQNKNAVIYGAGGSLGGAVARAMATAGANVFLTGHHIESVQKTAADIKTHGGIVEVDEVDATDENAIRLHLEKVMKNAGSVDISFNAIAIPVKQNMPLVEMNVDDFMSPITFTLHSQFLTATAAGKLMIKQGSGVILTLTATPGGIGYPYTAGFAAACCALECFSKNLASELGIYGIRVVNIRSAGSPDSRVFKEAIENSPDVMKEVIPRMESDTMLKKLPLMSDIAGIAVFLSSGMAGMITGVTVDVTAGTTSGLNYRVFSKPPDSDKSMNHKLSY